MAININSNFHVGTALPLDDRAYLTKQEMLAVNENIYPDYFLTVCADDGFVYMFDKNMEAEDISAETGKFKLFAGDVEEAIGILNADDTTKNSVRYWIKNLAAKGLFNANEVLMESITVDGEEAVLISLDDFDAIKEGTPKSLGNGYTVSWDEENAAYVATDEEGNEKEVTYAPISVADDTTIKEKIEEIEEANKVTIEIAEEATEGYLKTYIVSQGEEEIGKIDIPKDLVVESGSVIKVTKVVDEESGETLGYKLDDAETVTYTDADVEDKESDYFGYPVETGKFIKLKIANQKAPICINIKEIMPEGTGETTEDITANIAVGGIADGDIIPAGTDLQEFITKLVVKYFPPVISLSGSVSNKVQRVGTTLADLVLTASVTKKSKDVTGVTIEGEDVEDVQTGSAEYTKTIAEVTTTTEFSATATDGDKTATATCKYTFVYPYMHGVVSSIDAIDLDDLTEVIEVKGTKSFSYTANNEYCVFAMPASYADLTSILDPSSFENLKSWTKVEMTNDASESYKVYYTNTPVTCTGFKYTFK